MTAFAAVGLAVVVDLAAGPVAANSAVRPAATGYVPAVLAIEQPVPASAVASCVQLVDAFGPLQPVVVANGEADSHSEEQDCPETFVGPLDFRSLLRSAAAAAAAAVVVAAAGVVAGAFFVAAALEQLFDAAVALRLDAAEHPSSRGSL